MLLSQNPIRLFTPLQSFNSLGLLFAYSIFLLRRSQNIRFYENSQVIDERKGEMLCPFCKSIGNTILPHTPPHIAQSRLPLSALSSDAQSSREARVDVGSSNYLSCLLNSFTEQETDFQTDFTRYVKSLLPAAPASTPLVSDGTMEPTEISSSVAKGELSSSSPAYDSVIADGQFQEDIVSNFIPLWSAESSSLTTRFQTLLKTDLCRTTHLTWSAAAYTILSASRAKSWLSRENSGTEARLTHGLLDPVQDEREISFMYQLLLILRSIAPKLYNSNHSELEDGIIAPLGDLLAGCKTSSTASIFAKMDGERKESSCIITELPTYDQACSAVRSQPLLSVGTIAFPDLKRQSILIGHASRVNVNYDSTQRTMKKLGAKEKWPFLLTPLLEQDLHTIAIAFVSTATDITRTMDALSLICLARLAQILIEPAATGVAAVNSKVATALLKPEVSRHREHMKDSDSVYIDGGFAPSKVAIIDNVACHSSTSVAIANADSLVGQTPARKFRDSDATDTIFGISSRKREREREEGRYYEDQKDTSAPALLPDSIKNSSTGNEDITTADLGEKLEKLRGLIHLNCGIFSSVPHAPDASTQTYEWESRDSILKGLDLLRTVLDSWLPFLEFCCSLRVVLHSGSAATNIQADNLERMGMEVDDSGTEAQSLNGDIRHLCILLSTLGLLNQPLITPTYPTASSHEDMPSQLRALLSSHGLVSMCILWAEQMAADTATTAAASAPISWIPRPKASVKGSVTRTAEKVVSEHLRQNIDEIAAGVQQCGDTFTVPLQTQENIEIGNDGPSDEISHHYYNSEDEDEDDDDDDGSDDSDDLVDNVDDIENIDDQDHDDDDYEDDEESADSDDEGDGGMGFFEQQIAGFLANQPNGDDGTGRAPDMGGLMAAVMQHMGMEPNTEMPANVAAIFRSFQVRS